MLALLLLPLVAATLVNALNRDCGCGLLPGDNRIIRGREAGQGELPFMALLKVNFPTTSNRCGGTLINKRYILTARHCAMNDGIENFNNFEVKLGITRDNEEGSHVQKFTVGRENVIFYTSPLNMKNKMNDILLLRLNSYVSFTDKIRPACLPEDLTRKYNSGNAQVAGWGDTDNSRSRSNVLKKTTLNLYPLEDQVCTNTAKQTIPDSQLCAYKIKTDSCSGDSGGPLWVKSKKRLVVIGIVSYGPRCAKVDHAGIYTRVTSYMRWIKKNVADGWCGRSQNNRGYPTNRSGGNVTNPESKPDDSLTISISFS